MLELAFKGNLKRVFTCSLNCILKGSFEGGEPMEIEGNLNRLLKKGEGEGWGNLWDRYLSSPL